MRYDVDWVLCIINLIQNANKYLGGVILLLNSNLGPLPWFVLIMISWSKSMSWIVLDLCRIVLQILRFVLKPCAIYNTKYFGAKVICPPPPPHSHCDFRFQNYPIQYTRFGLNSLQSVSIALAPLARHRGGSSELSSFFLLPSLITIFRLMVVFKIFWNWLEVWE